MSVYIRPARPGAAVFFTVNLAQRGSALLVREIEALRQAVRATMAARPFRIDAWVVLPDHMHAVWTLPEGDSDYSIRWREIKGRFTMAVRRSGLAPAPDRDPIPQGPFGVVAGRKRVGASPGGRVGASPDLRKDEAPVWQKRFWEHHIRDDRDYRAHIRYCWMNPVKDGFVYDPRDWPYSSYHRDGEPNP